MRVRLAKKLRHEAQAAVTERKQSGGCPRGPGPGTEQQQDNKQQHPLQGKLIQLRGVPGQLQWVRREHHGPGHVRRATPELLADKIAEATQGQAHRGQQCGEVQHRTKREAATAGEPRDGDNHPDHAAVEGHTALPDPQQPQWILHQALAAVEQRVANPPTQDHSQGAEENQVVYLRPGQGHVRARAAPDAQPPRKGQSGEVGQPIPVHLDRSQRNGNGVDIRVRQHGVIPE